MTYLTNRVNTFQDIEQDLNYGLNRYNNYDLITLDYLVGLLARDSIKSIIVDLFEDTGTDSYKIISDYTIIPETGNLILNYKAYGNCNFNYSFEINLSNERITLVAKPKPVEEFSNTHNYFFHKHIGTSTRVYKNFIDERTTHAIKSSLLSLDFLTYLRSLYLYQLCYELKSSYNKYEEENNELPIDSQRAYYFADKIRENLEKINQIEHIIDKTCLRYYDFEKYHEKLVDANPVD
jgi:hypothetical protein